MKASRIKNVTGWLFAALLLLSQLAAAAPLDPALQEKLDLKLEEIQTWAADPAIVDAVKAYNAGKSPEAAAMDQAKWASTSVIDPFVRSLTKNAAAGVLKAMRGEIVAEAFLSGADGGKVAYLGKPANWSHLGSPKHDLPMSGKTWQGEVEVDPLSGIKQVQVAVPVFEPDKKPNTAKQPDTDVKPKPKPKPIGSLVIGLSIAQLASS